MVCKQVYEVDIGNNRKEPGTDVNKLEYSNVRNKDHPIEFRKKNSKYERENGDGPEKNLHKNQIEKSIIA